MRNHRSQKKIDGCNKGKTKQKKKTALIVLGSGGHTTEILMMTKNLNPSYYSPIIYCKASTDTTSVDRVKEQQPIRKNHADNTTTNSNTIYNIPRSREVGQSFLSSIYTTIYAILISFHTIYKIQPNILICNGPGTCIPLIIVVLFYRILFFWDCPIIFIESYCRVTTLSLTGKILYYLQLTDLFIVHWNELHMRYPKDTIVTSTFIATKNE